MSIEPTPIEHMEIQFGLLVNGIKNMLATLPASDDVRAAMEELEAAIKQLKGENDATRH